METPQGIQVNRYNRSAAAIEFRASACQSQSLARLTAFHLASTGSVQFLHVSI
jgi:hypothetical protein